MLCQIGELSARMVVMSERARVFLREVYDVPDAKIDLIAHGIPDMPFVDPNFYKDQFAVEGKLVALTFGLLSPNRESSECSGPCPPSCVSSPTSSTSCSGPLIPTCCAEQGEAYRSSLERLPGPGHQAQRQLLQPVRRDRRAD